MTSIMWFRRDLRLRDNPALREATADGPVLGLFVLEPGLWRNAGPARRAWLAASLRSLDESMDGHLCLRLGQARSVVPRTAAEVGADQVHVSNDFTPYGRSRDKDVVEALPDGVSGVATGTPYAVPPGTVVNGSGDPYKVFTPFSRAWRAHGWDDPQHAPRNVSWVAADGSRPHVAALAVPQARRRPPASAARGDGWFTQRGGADLRVRAGLARVLRRRAPPAPGLGLGGPAAGGGSDLRRPRGRGRGLVSRSSTPACASSS